MGVYEHHLSLPHVDTAAAASTESFHAPPVREAQRIFDIYKLIEETGGVFGDGWFPGVELTRDGRALSSLQETHKSVWQDKLRQAQHGPDATALSDSRSSAFLGKSDMQYSDARPTDRYGFFLRDTSSSTNSAEERTSLLTAQAYKTKSMTPATTLNPPRGNLTTARSPSSSEKAKETERAAKWLAMLQADSSIAQRSGSGSTWSLKRTLLNSAGERKRLRKRVYKGVPDRWRPVIWPILASTSADLSSTVSLNNSFTKKHSQTSSLHDTQIDLDIPRTLGSHTLFATRYGKGQRMLFDVLHDQSTICEDCGYCQGMAGIAGLCVAYGAPSLFAQMHQPASKSVKNGFSHPEKASFSPSNKFGMHDMMRTGFPGLHHAFERQEQLTKLWMPTVHKVLTAHGIHPSSYATKWYITLYTSSTFTFEMQLRTWDVYLLEGVDFLIIVSLAVLWGLRGYILHPNADFESIMSALSGSFTVQDHDLFMKWCRKRLDLMRKGSL